jgi:hypothetical protein
MLKNIFILLFFSINISVLAQCPISPNSFAGEYNLSQKTPIHPENTVKSFDDQVVTLNVGNSTNKRKFTAVYLEALQIHQSPMEISFTLDCNNGNSVIVDDELSTHLTCATSSEITLGSAATTGTFIQNNDSSFTLIIAEYKDDGGCGIPTPLVTEFALTKATCQSPQNVTVTSTGVNSALVSWNDNYNASETTYNVEYGTHGFTPGNGNIISNITSTSITLNNLQEDVFYDVYVTSNCNGESSLQTFDATFSTDYDCSTVYSAMPLSENFDNVGEFTSCFTVTDQDGNGTSWSHEETEMSPNVSDYAKNSANDAQKEDYLNTPAISMNAGTNYNISVTYNGLDTPNGAVANEDLEVIIAQGQTVTEANNGTSIFTDTGIAQNGDLSNIENQALTANATFTPSTSGDYHLVFKSTGSPAQSGNTTGSLLVFGYTVEVESFSTDEFAEFDFEFYANHNVLNLKANQSFDQISIFDLSGKKVMSQELSSNEENVAIQSLANGLYLAKVKIGEQTKTIKFLK